MLLGSSTRLAIGACVAVAALAMACATANVETTKRAGALDRPNRILVRNFATSRAEVELDQGIGPTIARDFQGEVASDQSRQLGHAAADALAAELVAKLREAGLPAERSSGRPTLTPDTLVIAGKFLTIDEGNQTMRTLIGFGAGASQVDTRAQAWMNGELVAEAETQATGNKKPGAAVTLGVGAAAGTAATAAVVAAGTTGVSELLLTSVQSDAKRTGDAIAERVVRAYRERGWLPD